MSAGRLPSWILALQVGELDTNCYMIITGQGCEAALIDPGGDPREIEQFLREANAVPAVVLLTHAHSDHWAALPDLLCSYPDCAVAASAQAFEWLADPKLNLSAWMGAELTVQPERRLPLTGGARVAAAGVDLSVIATPGHTPGCLSFLAATGPGDGLTGDGPVLFSGDVLFRGTAGRTDLPGGSPAALLQSLRRLADLPPTTLVLPGHGDYTTIGREVAGNEYVRRALRG